MNRSNSSRERLNALDGQIRETTCKLEDALEDHLSNQFLLQSESRTLPFSLDLQKVKQDINSFIQSMNTLKEEYINELNNPLPEEINDVGPSKIDFTRNRSKVIGFSDEVHKFKRLLTSTKEDSLEIYSLVGMAGICKTTLAKELFEDTSIVSHFSRRAWVNVGPKYQLKEILQRILVQVNPNIDKTLTDGNKSLADLKMMLIESLKDEKYLIILDDLWDTQLFKQLRWLFPRNVAGSRVFLITRIHRVATCAYYLEAHKMRFLNKEESWGLLREKIFGEECCPVHLEKAGKKIAEYCEGLPLAIITVADLLSKVDKTPEYWNKVAEKKTSVFVDAYNLMENILYPSYDYLPQHLKVRFLYMGVFPQNDEISCSKLIKLLSAEKLLEPISSLNSSNPHLPISLTLEKFAIHCLNELVSTNVVMVRKHKSNREMKTCSLHSAFWYLCIKEAGKNKFSHVINCYADGFAQGIKSLRRLCIHKNILFGIKDVHNSMTSVSNVHSLLCTGPYHQYPVPICFGLRLLRVLDALTVHFYEFPLEVLKLIELRYLALTFNKNIPPGISKLWNLEFFIVRRHLSINSSESPTYLPMEIWDMKELKHLQIMGSDLLDPRGGALLENLLTLLDVSAHTFTKGIVKRIPNIMKLGIRIELAPDSVEPLSFFDPIRATPALHYSKVVQAQNAPKREKASTSYYFKTKWVVALDIFESHLWRQFPSECKIVEYSRDFYDESFHELGRCFSKRVNVLDGQIREAVDKLHHVLESLVSEIEEPIQRFSVDGLLSSTQLVFVFFSNFDCPHFLCPEIETLTKDLVFNFEAFIQRLDKNRSSNSRERLKTMDGQIREMTCKLEDALEDHLSYQFVLQSEIHTLPFSLDLQKVKQDINSFIQSVKRLKDEYINELSNPLPQEINDVGPS
ncbi:hypothetical protein DH2020_013578 [Rehmannia glutinosa]|uniref:NB-ARC domain-containing protein n=1 Tax=Rehmannia glutinosa TaxID=99300 RepID=A0ABR0X3D5_REHGL